MLSSAPPFSSFPSFSLSTLSLYPPTATPPLLTFVLHNKMKSSLSSSLTAFAGGHSCCRLLILVFLLFLFSASSANRIIPSPTLPSETSSRTTHGHRDNHRYCDSFSHENSRSLCAQLQKLHQHRLPPPLPPQVADIDPRYGVEKRVVPSGPNPLHN